MATEITMTIQAIGGVLTPERNETMQTPIQPCGGILHKSVESAEDRAQYASAWNPGTYSVYSGPDGFLVINGTWQGVSQSPALVCQFRNGRKVL